MSQQLTVSLTSLMSASLLNKIVSTESNPTSGGAIITFTNGYGASVISNEYSYGGKEGLFEIAVLDYTGCITYDTSITDDVIGYLTKDEVIEYLVQISNLPLNE